MSEESRGEPIVVHSEARGCDVTIGYRGVWDRAKAKSEKQQKGMDASRKPLTDEERAVYANTSRRWETAEELGPVAILDSLIAKGWVQKSGLVYQKVHSLDELVESLVRE